MQVQVRVSAVIVAMCDVEVGADELTKLVCVYMGSWAGILYV